MSHMFLGSKILKSMQAFKREKEELRLNWPRSYSALKKKHFEEPEYIISPNLYLKVIWDFFVGALIMESVIVVPLRLGFHVEAKGFSMYFDILVDLCFAFDMILTFFTAYEYNGVTIVDPKKICMNYLKTWFTIDFLSTFPFDLVIPILLQGISPGALRSIKLVRALRLFRLLKLFRVARLKRKVKDAKLEDIFHPVVYDLIGLFFWIFIVSHVICCGFYYFSDCALVHGDWQSCGKDDLTSKYILSMYWTVATILSVGYGDVYLKSNRGRMFTNFVIFLGSLIFGVLVSTVQSSAKNWNKQSTDRIKKINQVREYIYEMKVIGSLRRKISNHFEYFYINSANGSEEAIVLEMPINLRQYALSQTKKHIMNLNFFKMVSLDVIMEIVPHLKPFLTKTGDFIYREGDFCVDMFFLVSGLVEAFKKCHDCGSQGNYLVGIYQTGSEFGLNQALTCTSVTWASFRSCDRCQLKWLSNDSIRQLIQSHIAIKEMFDEESQKEAQLMKSVEDSISTEYSGNCRQSEQRGSVKGAFRIPNCVIHNDVIINREATHEILQNIDLVDDDTDIVTTYKTVRIVGKINGQDQFLHAQETTEQMWSRWIINPHCQYKIYFDLVVVIMVMTSSLTVPYRMGFGLPSTVTWSVMDGITEVLFFLDLVSSFMTAYEYKDGTLDTNFKKIAFKYLRSWFIVDFISAVPFYRITAEGSSIGVVVRLLKTLKLGRLIRMFKVFKFARIMKLLEISNHDFIPNEFIAIQNSFGLIFKMLAFLGFTTHIIACIFSWISIDSKGETWASEAEDIDSTFTRYIAAMYWTYATMATVGYGDIFAHNDSERLFSIVVMVLGSTGLAYIISEMSDHVFNKGSGKGQQDIQLSISRDYFIRNSTPQSWRDALIQHYSYLMDKQTAFDHRLIWSQMPHALRTDLIIHLSRDDFSKIALFNSVKVSVLCTLYKYAEYCMVAKGSFMYTFETGSGGLYFVIEGYAEVVDEKDASKVTEDGDPMIVIASIQEGMFFGHESLLNTAFDFLGIRAKSDLYTLFISKDSMARMKQEVPLIYDMLVFIIEEAVKISFSTYEVVKNVRVLKRTISRIMRMRQFWKRKTSEILINTSTKFSQHVGASVKMMYKWINSDVDEAQSLYKKFSRVSDIVAAKAKKQKMEEMKKSIMSDESYAQFQAMKSQRLLIDPSLSPAASAKSSRNIYASLYSVSAKAKEKFKNDATITPLEPALPNICDMVTEEEQEDIEEEKENTKEDS